MAEDYLGFIGTIIGGAISGAVGFFVVWYSNRLHDKEQLKDNVYRRLYGYVIELYRQKAPNVYWVSPELWYKTEPYELLKMDQTVRAEFDKLAGEIEIWNKYSTTLGNNYQKNENNIRQILQDVFNQSNLLNPQGNLTIKDSNYSTDSFIRIFLNEIVNPKINDSDMLYKVMSDFAEQYYSNRVNDVTFLKEHKPKFFSVLFEQLPLLRQLCLTDVNYDQMYEYQGKIRNHVAKIKEQLEKLVK